MASGSEPRRCRQKLFCGHCNDYLPKSTFYRHRDSFFNPASDEWQTRSDDVIASSNSDRAREIGGQLFGETESDFDAASSAASSDREQDSAIPEGGDEATATSQLEGRLLLEFNRRS